MPLHFWQRRTQQSLPVKATPAGRLVVDLLEAKMIQDGCFGDRKWDNVGQADCDYESAL